MSIYLNDIFEIHSKKESKRKKAADIVYINCQKVFFTAETW